MKAGLYFPLGSFNVSFFLTEVALVLTECTFLYINDFYFCRMVKKVLNGSKLGKNIFLK